MNSNWLILFCLFLIPSCVRDQIDQQTPSRPNVLFISIDDLNHWAEPLGGHPQAKTPNLKAFAQNSVLFTNNYCVSPGCNPSRASVLLGKHTYSSGMYSNYQDWRKIPMFDTLSTLPGYFREQGYYTSGAGKIFHYQQVDTLAWDQYFPSVTQPMPKEHLPENRPVNMESFKYMYGMFDWSPIPIDDTMTADYKSVDFISSELQKDHQEPFFLACGIYRPHVPWYVPQKYFDMHPLDQIELPEVLKQDLADLGPRAIELVQRGGNYHRHVVEAGQWQKAVQGYLASMSYADAMLGKLLDDLANSPYAENTIVVIWSDHGWQLGEKEHWRKFALWKNVIQTLCMIHVPKENSKLPDGSADGYSCHSMTSLLDIYPTLTALCDLPDPHDLDGESLVPLLAKPDTLLDRAVLTTYDYGDYSVRYENWHLINYIDGTRELYDLKTDPFEWNNLASVQSFDPIIQMLNNFIPDNPVDLPEVSLLELQEHHIPPVKSKAYYYSAERTNWLKRFDN